MLNVHERSGGLVSECRRIDDPGDLLSLRGDAADERTFLSDPARDEAVAACGVAAEVRTSGSDRFAEASRILRALLARCETIGDGPGPIAVGGFAFEPDEPGSGRWREFGSLRLVVPELAWIRRGGVVWQVRTWHTDAEPIRREPPGVALVPPTALEDRAAWCARVREALAAITDGSLRKVVLAREREECVPAALDAEQVIRRLHDTRPTCTTFWIRRGALDFVGSSPELLARVTAGDVEAVALAGTARRQDEHGADVAAADALLACPKNRAEHVLVADEVRVELDEVCTSLVASPRTIERFPEAMHIATHFHGRLATAMDVLQVAGRLHPTSAVCGLPRTAASALIHEREPERGWYAGGVGWMDARGDGAFSVALRCGLLSPGRATIWAGAGIVAGSDPDAEYDETEAKMTAMASALAGACP